MFKTLAKASDIAKYGREVVNNLCGACKNKATMQQKRHQGNVKMGSLKFTDYCEDCQAMQKRLWAKHFDN